MAGVNIGNLGLLQLRYEPLIVEALASGAKAFNRPEVTNWEGDLIDFRVHVGRNVGMGWTEDGGAFSVPDKQDYVTARVGRRFFQTKLQISTGALAAARTDKNAFRSALDSEVKGATKDVIKFFNKFFFLDGTGTVALLQGTPATLTANIQVDNAGLLYRKAVLEVRDTSSSDASLGDIKVLSVEPNIDSTGWAQFALDTGYLAGAISASAVAGDKLVWKDGYNRAISGLDALIDDSATTFQNVDVSLYPEYAAYVNSNGGTMRPMTPLLLRQTLTALKQKQGNTEDVGELEMFANAHLAREFEEMYEGAYRLMGSNETSTVGMKSTHFVSSLGRIDVTVDTDCPRNKVFLCDNSQLRHCVQKPLGFDKDGGQIFRNSHNSMHATAIMTGISQMMIKDRKSSAKIEDLQDNAVIAW